MPDFFLKRKKPSFINIKINTNIKCYLYRNVKKNGNKKLYILEKKKKVEEIIKLTNNLKYNEITCMFRKNINYNGMKKKHIHYCNFLKADILTLLKGDIEKLKKNKFKYLSIGNRKHSFKKVLTNCIFSTDIHQFVNTAHKHINKANLYQLFILLKLSLHFKNCEFFKLNALEAFINKVKLYSFEKKNRHAGKKKDTKLLLTCQHILDSKFFVNTHGIISQHDPTLNIYIFDIVNFVNESINSVDGNHDDPSHNSFDGDVVKFRNQVNSADDSLLNRSSNEDDSLHNRSSNEDDSLHNRVSSIDYACLNRVRSGAPPPSLEKREEEFSHLNKSGNSRHKIAGGKGDPIKHEGYGSKGMKDKRKKWSYAYKLKKNNEREESNTGRNDEMYADEVHVDEMYGDKIYEDEIKYFFYNHGTNHLGVYKEIFEKSDQYKCLKYYEKIKNHCIKDRNVINDDDTSIKQELQNNKLKSSFLLNSTKLQNNNHAIDKQNCENIPSSNGFSAYMLKECILYTFLSVCVNNYDDRNYKYMKDIYFKNFYFYNPLFLFHYFSYISTDETKFYEKYLNEFLKFLNNIIIHFHFYLIPFFTNLNYSSIFLDFFKKKIAYMGRDETIMLVYRKSTSFPLIKERVSYSYTYKNCDKNEKKISFILYLFYQIYGSDNVVEKAKQIYLDNFYLYSSEQEKKKKKKKIPVSIFFNFLNYQSVFNKYENELKQLYIQKKLFYKPTTGDSTKKIINKNTTLLSQINCAEEGERKKTSSHLTSSIDEEQFNSLHVRKDKDLSSHGKKFIKNGMNSCISLKGRRRSKGSLGSLSPTNTVSENCLLRKKELWRYMHQVHQELFHMTVKESCNKVVVNKTVDDEEERIQRGVRRCETLVLNDYTLKYNNISVRKREILYLFLILSKYNFTQSGNYLNKILFFFLNEYCEKDLMIVFVNHLKNNGSNYDLLLLNKILNIFIYKKKNISLNSNITICNNLAKYQLFNNNFFALDKKNFFDQVHEANIHSLVALLYSWGKLKVKNLDIHFYKVIIKEIIQKIDKINEYGLSCLLYGLNNLIDKKKGREEKIILSLPNNMDNGKAITRFRKNRHDEDKLSDVIHRSDSTSDTQKYLSPSETNTSNQIGLYTHCRHDIDKETAEEEKYNTMHIILLENELIRAIIKKLIMFKNMNINSFCISISCLSKINIFPKELYEEIKTVTYKYMYSVNVTSLQHLLLALSKYYIKTNKNHNPDDLIFDIFNFLFTYKYKDISFKCACKFLHILSLLNLRDEDFILLLLLVIANEQRALFHLFDGDTNMHNLETIRGKFSKIHPSHIITPLNVSSSGREEVQHGYRTLGGTTNIHAGKEFHPICNDNLGMKINQGEKCNKSSIFLKGLNILKEDEYFKSSHNAYLFFDVKNYKFELSKVLSNFKNVDNSYLINVLESLYNLSYYSYFSIHLTLIIKNILIKQIHDLKVSGIMILLFSHVDLHFFDYSLYDIELKLFLNEEDSSIAPQIDGFKSSDEQSLLLESSMVGENKKEFSNEEEKNEEYNKQLNKQALREDNNSLEQQFNSVYNYMLHNFKSMNEEEKMICVEKLKLLMYKMKKKKMYYVNNIYNENNTPSVEYIISMIYDYEQMRKANHEMPDVTRSKFIADGRRVAQITNNSSGVSTTIMRRTTRKEEEKLKSDKYSGNNIDIDRKENKHHYKTDAKITHKNNYVENSLKKNNFEKLKNIVDQFSSVKKFHLKDKILNKKLEEKIYYDDFFFLKYREYYKEDLINLCLETILKNTNYILNNYKQYKNCSIFFLLLFCNIFLPYTTNDIFLRFKCIQRNYNYYKKKNLQHDFDQILKNIELSDFNEDTIRNAINAKNASHLVIPYLNILQHNNGFLNKAICTSDKKEEGVYSIADNKLVSGENYGYIEKEHKSYDTYQDQDNLKECEYFINSYDTSYKMKKIKFEDIVPLNLLYKFFQLFNFNINNVQFIYLLNEMIKENNDFNEPDSDYTTLKFGKNDISPYQFRNLSYPLIQIRNKTLIIHKNSKKCFFKSFNVIDHYFKPSQGMLIQILDNGIHNLISIYVNVYVVAYKVDILLERNTVMCN
ncbi:hypothetical protein, conserved [Plasmodium gonderi]|uniref:Uncharacterized protein n=1 Tax=Plasmodium gonderi TaxID=77519 RepID=A0A1Y1JMC1_PLAGO|nr:hypothetical protein, conserved [Plasmodium gonderi]GAW83746.1 hypothetical protein, conserved [Plasmodium gonderi]